MFKRIIVATDFSPASFEVVRCLGGLKAFGVEECLLLQCLKFADAASAALSYHTEPLDKMLNEQKSELENQGFTVEARTVVGPAKREVTRIAKEENYSLIVVGAQGHSIAEEKLLGGVAYGIIHKAAKPVLVVPVQKKQGSENLCEPIARCSLNGHVLFATDFSELADHVFTYVEALVANGAQKITLVHVQDKTKLEPHLKSRLEEFNEIDRKRLENLKQILREKGVSRVDIEICYGVPYEEIARLIKERDAHLVTMGAQGRGFVGEILLGSVSHHVIRHSQAPVLLIPAHQQ